MTVYLQERDSCLLAVKVTALWQQLPCAFLELCPFRVRFPEESSKLVDGASRMVGRQVVIPIGNSRLEFCYNKWKLSMYICSSFLSIHSYLWGERQTNYAQISRWTLLPCYLCSFSIRGFRFGERRAGNCKCRREGKFGFHIISTEGILKPRFFAQLLCNR